MLYKEPIAAFIKRDIMVGAPKDKKIRTNKQRFQNADRLS